MIYFQLCTTNSATGTLAVGSEQFRSPIFALVKMSFNGQWLWLSGRTVAFDTRDPRFESRHRQTFI